MRHRNLDEGWHKRSVPHALTPDEFQELTGVSRETLKRLEIYIALLHRWQPAINLVGKSSLTDPWRRHFLDSAQLLHLLPPHSSCVADLGSGAGFPGLVLAILGAEEVHLIEADSRKCAFLREALRVTETRAVLHQARIEEITGLEADVITARALAPLRELITYALPLLKPQGICLFPRGRGLEEELTQAVKKWMMQVERFASQTEPGGWIVRLREIRRKRADGTAS